MKLKHIIMHQMYDVVFEEWVSALGYFLFAIEFLLKGKIYSSELLILLSFPHIACLDLSFFILILTLSFWSFPSSMNILLIRCNIKEENLELTSYLKNHYLIVKHLDERFIEIIFLSYPT